MVAKTALMPILAFFAYLHKPKEKVLYLALLFSWTGDISLMFNGEIYFILGLSSFLLAHLFYVLLFTRAFKFKLLPSLVLLAVTLCYFIFLSPHITKELYYPVLAYCIVITTMGLAAISRPNTSYYTILIGALLFIISDSFIALNMFYTKLTYPALYIMSTYGLAQYLIVSGWFKRDSL